MYMCVCISPPSKKKTRIGEFQCFDKYLLNDLKKTANGRERPEWGKWGPHNSGSYNEVPERTGFFCYKGSYQSEYGKFFLSWYSRILQRHADNLFEIASVVFRGCKTKLAGKVAGVHWWYNSHSHAAELTAGLVQCL